MSDTVRFLGCGDSFGSGGRFQTCILGDIAGHRFLIDCGASSLIAMRAQGVDPNSIEAIVLTHLHGDHCGGIPFLVLDAMLASRRQAPLVIAGPPGTKAHLALLLEALFPGSAAMKPRFPLEILEMRVGEVNTVSFLEVTPYPAVHTPDTHPTLVRVATGGRVVTYTGDSDWTDALVDAADGADLLISECYFYDKPVKMHMNYKTLSANLHRLKARNVVLTHLSPEMLDRADQLPEKCAYDGMVVAL